MDRQNRDSPDEDRRADQMARRLRDLEPPLPTSCALTA